MPSTRVLPPFRVRVKDAVLIVAGSMGVLKVAVIALRVAVITVPGSGSVAITTGGIGCGNGTTWCESVATSAGGAGCCKGITSGPRPPAAAVLTVEKPAEGETEAMLDI